jgi:formylglycine-generating enzyme required for sulfatase activity
MAPRAAAPRRRAWLWSVVAAAVVLCLAGGIGLYVVMDIRAREARELAEAEDKAWVQAKAANTMAAYQEYLGRYPAGRHADEARRAVAVFERQQQADEEAWAQARNANTVAAYQEYLRRYPTGRHAAEARQAVAASERQQQADEEAWTRARAANNEAGYRAYLERYPSGRFAADARREIERLGRPPQPAQAFRDCQQCPEMIPVARGSFVMGPAPGEEDREQVEADERQKGPLQRRVSINDFALGKYPVTRGEFAAFVAATGYNAGNSCVILQGGKLQPVQGRSWQNPLFHQTDRHPVVCVNVTDAQAYAAWLAKQTGKPYRLPSEAEWEYAARAGTTTTRYWGNDRTDACRHQNVPDFSMAAGLNFPRDNNIFHCVDKNIFTSAVDDFPPNPWGFHDMLGNVYQRLSDCWHPTYDGAPADGRSWDEGGDCSQRVVRGGAWWGAAAGMRAASRARGETTRYTIFSGFRVARGN